MTPRLAPRLLAVLLASSLVGCRSAGQQRASVGSSEETIPTAEATAPGTTTPLPPVKTSGRACGVERWGVKTGADPEARQVDTASVRDATIAALGSLTRPADPTSRAAPVEETMYRVHATLAAYKREPDGDLHLVLSDGAGHTMIAEIPSPSCDAGSAFADQIRAARTAFDARHLEQDIFVDDGEPVTVAGVGFFDSDHGQRGVAPNAIELHPVLSISFGAS